MHMLSIILAILNRDAVGAFEVGRERVEDCFGYCLSGNITRNLDMFHFNIIVLFTRSPE
jgi:hypothetical protein